MDDKNFPFQARQAWAAKTASRGQACARYIGVLRQAGQARSCLRGWRLAVTRERSSSTLRDLADARSHGAVRELIKILSNCSKIFTISASKIEESECKKSTQAKNHPEIQTENRKHETTKRKTKPRSTTAALREQHHHAESH